MRNIDLSPILGKIKVTQTLERANNVKISLNVPNDIGEKINQESDADYLALKAFELVYFFLEKSGKTLDQITPELLGLGEHVKKESTTDHKEKINKNKAISALLQEIKTNGGIKKETAEEIRTSGREFRDDFAFEHDKS